MVYVLNFDGVPLMPTERYGKVRRLLKAGRAVVVREAPFTIQLTYGVKNYTQEITLGVDVGSKTIGASASAKAFKLKLIQKRSTFLIERRYGVSSTVSTTA